MLKKHFRKTEYNLSQMRKTYAVIDIGTLKVKLLIASLSKEGNLIEKYSSSTLTCFGCDMDKNDGNILEGNIVKTIKELKRCMNILKKHGVERYRVVSTHAMRRAKNKDEIIKRIKKETGFEVENISQEKEAELFFNAVLKDFPFNKEYAVLDMGGGSVQILVGSQNNLKIMHMMQTGAQYLHDNFTKDSGNPRAKTTSEDIEKMREYILTQLLPLKKEKNVPIIYGSTNIIDLMETIGLPLDPNENSINHPYKTYSKHLEKFIQKMLPLPYYKREKLFDFQYGYMWGIDKAFLNLVLISEHFGSPYIVPSNENIAKGFIYEMHDKS